MLPTDYLALLNDEVSRELPGMHYGKGGGDGVIYVGGGRYWPMIATGIHMLRRAGSTLPVEVWYRGDCEPVDIEDVAGLNVSFFDVDAMGRELGDSRIPTGKPTAAGGGWEAKLYALYHTNLDRVFYIDADAYFVDDPKVFFDMNEGFIFWKDLPSQANSIKWDHVFPGGCRVGVPQIQGGQVLIDRIKMWKVVHACFYMCQHSDFYFKHMYGDQDTWRVALAATKLPYRMLGKADWEDIAFVCRHADKPYVVHRCRGKMFEHRDIPRGMLKYSNPQYRLPKEVEVFNVFADIVNARGHSASDVFQEIYVKRLWGPAALSGTGSTLKEGQLYIDTVNKLIRSNGYQSVIDLGCGDGLIGSKIECAEYLGIDCYPRLTQLNIGRFRKNYLTLDFYRNYDIIPSGDILLIKDVFHHWPNAMVTEFLDNLIRSKHKWQAIIMCQDSKQIQPQQDCHLGGYRALSFDMEPLSRYPVENRVKVHHKELGVIKL